MTVVRFDTSHGIGQIQMGDAFFLDTNFIVSFFHENDQFHEVSSFLFHVLRYKQCTLYINSTVVAESINSLARARFVDDMYERFTESPTQAGIALSPRQIQDKKDEFRKMWFKEVLKDQGWLDGLAFYNKFAADLVLRVVNLCKMIPTNNRNLQQAIVNSYQIPIGSTDAVILTEALASGVHGINVKALISYDRDIRGSVSRFGGVTFTARNHNDAFLNRRSATGNTFAYNTVIRNVPGLEQFMRDTMGINPATGKSNFEEKYR